MSFEKRLRRKRGPKIDRIMCHHGTVLFGQRVLFIQPPHLSVHTIEFVSDGGANVVSCIVDYLIASLR